MTLASSSSNGRTDAIGDRCRLSMTADSEASTGGTALLLLLMLYAALLTRGITQPWIGLHDWNGAFFSQLARNLLRYPFALHHGMPMSRSATRFRRRRAIHLRHPSARAGLARRRRSARPGRSRMGRPACIHRGIAGDAGPVFPLHLSHQRPRGRDRRRRRICTPAHVRLFRANGRPRTDLSPVHPGRIDRRGGSLRTPTADVRRRHTWLVWCASIAAAIWIDWPGMLAAGLLSIYAIVAIFRGRAKSAFVVRLLLAPAAAAVLLLSISCMRVSTALERFAADLLVPREWPLSPQTKPKSAAGRWSIRSKT